MPTSSPYGSKYMGLQRLKLVAETLGFEVPPFVGLTVEEANAVVLNDVWPKGIIDFINCNYDEKIRFTVRSSSSNEDKNGQSNAGCYETKHTVKPYKNAIKTGIKKVLDSYNSEKAKSQLNLYKTSDFIKETDEYNQSPGGIVIQVMIGELAGKPIPVSGVGLSPDPRIGLKNTFNFSYALGHGKFVVNSKVPTDKTFGRYSADGKIHARSLTSKQGFRARPKDEQGLTRYSNKDTPLRMRPKLNEAVLQKLSLALKSISSQHDSGGDIELVVQGETIYLVQQRSQDVRNRKQSPEFLNPAFLDKSKKKHWVNVVAFRSSGVYTINPQERAL